jgi:hypothetical protein
VSVGDAVALLIVAGLPAALGFFIARRGSRGSSSPVSFCDPWPFAFNLLGQEGFLRFFRLTICAAEGWLDVEPEPRG